MEKRNSCLSFLCEIVVQLPSKADCGYRIIYRYNPLAQMKTQVSLDFAGASCKPSTDETNTQSSSEMFFTWEADGSNNETCSVQSSTSLESGIRDGEVETTDTDSQVRY